MNTELDKYDLEIMVLGSQLQDYSQMDHYLVKKVGNYIGGFTDSWRWEREKVKTLTKEELFELYQYLKEETIKKRKQNFEKYGFE